MMTQSVMTQNVMAQSAMTQSAITQAAGLLHSSASAASSKGKQPAGSFDLIMENNRRPRQTSSGNTATNQTDLQAAEAKARRKEEPDFPAEQTNTAGNKDVTKTSEMEDSAGKEALNSSQEGSSASEKVTAADAVEKKLMEQLAGILQAVRELVFKVLNLSEEELNQLLEEQGMSSADLLQDGNLQQLFMADQGITDILDVITNENMAASLQQLLQGVEEIKDIAGFQLSDEQLKSLLLEAQTRPAAGDETVHTDQTEEVPGHSQNPLAKAAAAPAASEEKEEPAEPGISLNSKSTETAKSEEVTTGQKNSDSDQRRENNQEIKAEDQFQAFIDHLVKSTQSLETDYAGNLVQVTQLRDIANQIIDRIKVTIEPGQTSMEMQLNPEDMGRMKLSVQSKNGIMTAQFVVQNDIAREAIEGQLHILRDTLNQQGIKVEAIEVTVTANAFEQNSSQNSSSQSEEKKSDTGRKITMEEALGMTKPDEEETVQSIDGLMGSQIDYTA